LDNGRVREALLILPGVVAAAAGGEFFVRSTVGAAGRLRIAPGIVAATVAAFATSSPELSVGITSALRGQPEISLGDVLGSNVVNVGLILAIAILMGGLIARRQDLRRDIPPALAAPVLIALLGLDGQIARGDAAILLLFFAAWLTVTVVQAARERSVIVGVLADRTLGSVTRDGVLGLGLLILAGRLIVLAAEDLGDLLGWDTFVVGAIMVAVATSVPELATVVVARMRGHDEVSVGTVLGSNIFNGMLIVGVAASIHPIEVSRAEFGLSIVAGIVTMLLVIPGRTHRLPPARGVALLLVYGAYLWALGTVHGGG
jgi:cation:H+ antiporter